MADLNAWNAQFFAERPTGQTPQESILQWKAVREQIQAMLKDRDDSHLNDPVWYPLPGCGWLPAAAALGACIAHGWSEFVQLQHVSGIDARPPAAEAVHTALGFLVNFMPGFMNREAANGITLSVRMEYPGPGGGTWTIKVQDGNCILTEGVDGPADMIMTQSPETSELMRQKKIGFEEAMQSGALKIQGMEHMGTFGQLFAEPALDTRFEPMSPGASD